MRIEIKDILDRHKDTPCAITAHGPSLNLNKQRIIELQQSKQLLRLSVNNWWDYFTSAPDYWILSSSEHAFPMRILFDIIKNAGCPIFYSDDGDWTSKETIDQQVDGEWLVYDQRHWEGKTCIEILKQFKSHYEQNKNFEFKRFGNNEVMWHPPRCYTNSGHALDGKCCAQNNPPRTTLQEYLQNLTGASQHYSTGDTVSMHAIAFAIIMGCNPIYVSGLDLDYNKGYANSDKDDWKVKAQGPNAWTPVRENLQNDIRVLSESAKKRGIEIINLNPDPWYDSFEVGELK